MTGQLVGLKMPSGLFLSVLTFLTLLGSDIFGQSIPDATLESSLRPVSSLEDVTMFEFEVPRDTVVAHWEFAAFQDDEYCPVRRVLIYVKHGSYPAILPGAANNHEKADFNATATASFQKAPAAGLRVASPKPGPWFAVAYMPEWDDKVELKGITHKCRYSIGAVAYWNRDTAVTPLVFSRDYHLETSTNFRRFRFYVDESINRIKLTISNCTSILSLRRRSNLTDCLKNVIVLAESPPYDSESEANAFSTGPISSATKNVSLDITPGLGKETAFFYIGIESEAAADFNLRLEATNVCQPDDRLSSSQPALTTDGVVDGDDCPVWRRLSRVSRPRDFEADFLFENKYGATNTIDLFEDRPVLITFELLPYLDVGGSLHVRLRFFDDPRLIQNASTGSDQTQNLEIGPHVMMAKGFLVHDAYVNASRVLSGEAVANLIARSQPSSSGVEHLGTDAANALSIPFPRPGAYSLLIVLECYDAIHRSQRVTCTGKADKSGAPVTIDVKTRMCSVPDWDHPTPCGSGGTCREAHRRRWFFTYCECYPGYSGWNCSKMPNGDYDYALRTASSLLSPGWSVAFLTGSNAAFVPVVFLAAKRRLWSAMGIYALMAVFSIIYHACDVLEKDDVDGGHFCFLYFELLAFLDFLGSSSAIWITLCGLANLPRDIKSAVDVVGVVVVAGAVHYSRTGLLPILLPIVVGAVIVVFSHAWSNYRARKLRMSPSLFISPLVGLLLALVAFLLFAFVETDRNYSVVHSIWHVMIGAALLFLLPKTNSRIVGNSEDDRLSTEMLEVVDAESSDDVWLIDNCDEEDGNEDCEEEEQQDGDVVVNVQDGRS